MRSGVIAQKVGMTRLFTDAGEHVPVTVLRLAQCQVISHRSKEKDGYVALQLGSGTRKVKNVSKAERGRFAVAKVEPKRTIAEFRVSDDSLIPVGAEITADHFLVGQFVDVTGTSIGKGYAGGMKRWNFGGLRKEGPHASRGLQSDAGRDIDQCKTSHSRHVRKGDFGGNQTAERHADEMATIDTDRLQHLDPIHRKSLDGIVAGPAAFAVAAQIQCDQSVASPKQEREIIPCMSGKRAAVQ